MVLGIIVFSLLFVVFVALGTLLLCGKGYFLISGYRALTDSNKELFKSKNNLKKVFEFYAYYCYAVALVTLLALIGACVNSMVIIFICYLVFGAGTIAAMIVSNSSAVYKINPIDVSIIKSSTPVANPTPEVAEKVEEKKAPAKKEPAKKAEPKVEEVKEEKVKEKTEATEKKAPAKKTTTKKAPPKKAAEKVEEKVEEKAE